jgi:hypothetical protein
LLDFQGIAGAAGALEAIVLFDPQQFIVGRRLTGGEQWFSFRVPWSAPLGRLAFATC